MSSFIIHTLFLLLQAWKDGTSGEGRADVTQSGTSRGTERTRISGRTGWGVGRDKRRRQEGTGNKGTGGAGQAPGGMGRSSDISDGRYEADHFSLARGRPRSEDSKKPLTNTNNY